MEKEIHYCPNEHGLMVVKKIPKNITFRGEEISIQEEIFVCEKCGIEVATIEQTAAIQDAISDAYRKKMGLLTGAEIREQRESLSLTQQELAKRTGVGIASIKRWENGIIQTKSMNISLKEAFQKIKVGNSYTGNRALSIPRIKLVMKEFEKELGESFLEEGDMMLFDAKYLWYADMIAFHRIGQSLTGATYAALPHGPQMNNYKELIGLIRDSDETEATPLTDEEKKIILRVALAFPKKQLAYEASHREEVWNKKTVGSTIPYSDAAKLTEIQT
ncbi:MAG: type II toxin-antitoxin system MqsA family antitoxin [Deltaproteobacteria bacterium]|nr:type II toxin-antitoxin system MqsA family antitoxin [Deltaproteobacteria bacterium]